MHMKHSTKQQVVVIGGGETFDTYEEYLAFIEGTMIFDPYSYGTRKPNWKENLRKDLGHRYEVITLQMPNKLNAKYKEWELYFRKVLPFLKENVIFVGHSLGALFISKYVMEKEVSLNSAHALLVSCPYAMKGEAGYADFGIDRDTMRSTSDTETDGEIIVFHSTDDTIVPIEKSIFPVALENGTPVREFHDRGHFIHDEHFPELVSEIKKLRKGSLKRGTSSTS